MKQKQEKKNSPKTSSQSVLVGENTKKNAHTSVKTYSIADMPPLNLCDHFLIAMPNVDDVVFGGTVVYVCEHNEEGALGIIINRPTDVPIEHFYNQLEIGRDMDKEELSMDALKDIQVMFGGPVQCDRGFVLHEASSEYTSSLKISSDIVFTTSKDVLEAMFLGDAPEKVLLSIGYASWDAGQLEQEIVDNGWLTVKAHSGIIFDTPNDEKFDAALKLLGFDPSNLVSQAAHA